MWDYNTAAYLWILFTDYYFFLIMHSMFWLRHEIWSINAHSYSSSFWSISIMTLTHVSYLVLLRLSWEMINHMFEILTHLLQDSHLSLLCISCFWDVVVFPFQDLLLPGCGLTLPLCPGIQGNDLYPLKIRKNITCQASPIIKSITILWS